MNINVPISWLKEYLKADINNKTLADLLTASGPSVEKIFKKGDDQIFDTEITTNRGDAYSIYGVAREGNTILKNQNYKSNLLEPKGLSTNLHPDTNKLLPLDVVIKGANLCPRFTAIVVDNIKIRQSPAYIRNRLEASGVRAINNIVDISNYIMLELGQPMHTFDYDKIKGSKMLMRKSTKGETIKTLDDNYQKIPEDSIVIEDRDRLIDLCGIMGGANSAVSTRTKRVVLFVQAYNPQLIRKTSQKLAVRTEASSRFEKGLDLEGVLLALKRAVYLSKEFANAKIASELIDIYPNKHTPKTIRLNTTKLDNYLGIHLDITRASQILKSLGFEVMINPNQIVVKTPSWRSLDIENDVDIIEEIARIYGYHKLPSKLPLGEIPKEGYSPNTQIIELKKALKYLGLTELITYSIISQNLLKATGKSEKSAVELSNPLTEDWHFMRPSIIPSLLQVIVKNKNVSDNLQIYEIANTYLPQKNKLPKQDLILTVCLTKSNFKNVKGLVENISELVNRDIKFTKNEKGQYIFNPEQSAYLTVDNEIVGIVGKISSNILDLFSLDTDVFGTEINLTKIFNTPQKAKGFTNIAKYPPVLEDLSVIVAQALPLNELVEEVYKVDHDLLKEVRTLDVFQNPKLGDNKKSVTLRLTFQKSSRTPTVPEAQKVKLNISSHLEKIFRAKIRK